MTSVYRRQSLQCHREEMASNDNKDIPTPDGETPEPDQDQDQEREREQQ